jgi:hypothetical protein
VNSKTEFPDGQWSGENPRVKEAINNGVTEDGKKTDCGTSRTSPLGSVQTRRRDERTAYFREQREEILDLPRSFLIDSKVAFPLNCPSLPPKQRKTNRTINTNREIDQSVQSLGRPAIALHLCGRSKEEAERAIWDIDHNCRITAISIAEITEPTATAKNTNWITIRFQSPIDVLQILNFIVRHFQTCPTPLPPAIPAFERTSPRF